MAESACGIDFRVGAEVDTFTAADANARVSLQQKQQFLENPGMSLHLRDFKITFLSLTKYCKSEYAMTPSNLGHSKNARISLH